MNLTLREWSAVMSAVSMAIGTVWYAYLLICGGQVKPVVTSWIVSAGTLALSFATYWASPVHSIVSGVANGVSLIGAGTLLIIMLSLNIMHGKKISFSKWQKIGLYGSLAIAVLWVVIVIVWGFKGSGAWPNSLLQILMIVSYSFTIHGLWNSDKNTESFVLWGGICVSGLFGLYTALAVHDYLAASYALRSAACSGFTCYAMYRIVRRQKMPRTAALA